jgi:large subunit ribosomal protein L5
MSNLKKLYFEKVLPAAKKQFGITADLAIPRMEKIVINIGTGNSLADEKDKEMMKNTLIRITGQKPVETLARKSISNFKIRKGMKVGLKVTLRGTRMYDFMEKLVNITLPRVRDFRGIRPESIDKQGNLNIGIREHNAFAEIHFDEIERIHGMEISVHMTNHNKEMSEFVLRGLGFPFAEAGVLRRGGESIDRELSSQLQAKEDKSKKKDKK